jgi:hypothetical protein
MPQLVVKNVQTSLLCSHSTLLNSHAATKLLSDLTQNLGNWTGKKVQKSNRWAITTHSFHVTAIFGKICPTLLKHKITNHLGAQLQSIAKEHSTNSHPLDFIKNVWISRYKIAKRNLVPSNSALPTTILSIGFIRNVLISSHK